MNIHSICISHLDPSNSRFLFPILTFNSQSTCMMSRASPNAALKASSLTKSNSCSLICRSSPASHTFWKIFPNTCARQLQSFILVIINFWWKPGIPSLLTGVCQASLTTSKNLGWFLHIFKNLNTEPRVGSWPHLINKGAWSNLPCSKWENGSNQALFTKALTKRCHTIPFCPYKC